MKIRPEHRKRVEYYLKEFYKRYPDEKHTIFHFVRYLKIRCKKNKDAWIGVSGDTSSGKSYMTLMMMILFGRPASLTGNVTYIPKGKEIMEKFDKLSFNVMIIDEAAQQMRAVQWQDRAQQRVNIAAMTERYKQNVVFLNLPNFDEFTKSMRRGSIILRMIAIYRTDKYVRVVVQRKSRNFRSEDPWGDKLANERYEKLEKRKIEINNDTMLSIERGIPNTIMDFIVPNLELIVPDITAEYERLKRESRKENDKIDDSGVKRNAYKEKYENMMANVTKILYQNELNIGKVKTTKAEIAAALGVTVDTLNRYLLMNRQKARLTVNPRSSTNNQKNISTASNENKENNPE